MEQLLSRIVDRARWELKEWRQPTRQAFVQEELDHAILDRVQWTPGERVLDIGCAHGSYLRALVERGARPIGVDLDIRSLAKAGSQSLSVAAADGVMLPFAAGSFDSLLCHKTMHLFCRPQAVIEEFKRVLRPGGRIVFSTSNMTSPYARAQTAALRNGRYRNWHRSNRLSAGQWRRAFAEQGMTTRTVYSCNLAWPLVYRVCDRWIIPNEWMRRYNRWVRRVTRVPLQTQGPLGAAMDYVIEVVKTD